MGTVTDATFESRSLLGLPSPYRLSPGDVTFVATTSKLDKNLQDDEETRYRMWLMSHIDTADSFRGIGVDQSVRPSRNAMDLVEKSQDGA